MKIIRDHSDDLIDGVFDELYSKMEGSNFYEEDIIFWNTFNHG